MIYPLVSLRSYGMTTCFICFIWGTVCQGELRLVSLPSNDGVSFRKFAGNPVLAPDDNGFDAFTAGPGRVLIDDSVWVMYYNGQELAGFSPGKSVGRATALIPTGPWKRSETPVLSSGSKGEWDDGFIIPCSVLKLNDSSYRMYYLGGTEITIWKDFYVGMATSFDGINWKKHNDPTTTQHPFAESDPVLMNGNTGDWDEPLYLDSRRDKLSGRIQDVLYGCWSEYK